MNELEKYVALGYISCNVEGLARLRDGDEGERESLLQSDGSKASWTEIQRARESLLKKIIAQLPKDHAHEDPPKKPDRVRKRPVDRKKRR